MGSNSSSVTGSVLLPMGQRRLDITLLNWIISAFFLRPRVSRILEWVEAMRQEAHLSAGLTFMLTEQAGIWTIGHFSCSAQTSASFCPESLAAALGANSSEWTPSAEGFLLAWGTPEVGIFLSQYIYRSAGFSKALQKQNICSRLRWSLW